ncbi:MAG: putative selenium-dependent hydroxylase accessory protein YqeC [Phototrophicales bacterium]|nr:MAG: putative selenium-dependent hydroxylase accessory protein YqeC [Phototrophicales bacterium]
MRLADALGIQRGDVVSFVGAGGKTTALLRLGYELVQDGWRVLATTTTRIGEDQLALFPHSTRWQSNLLRQRELAALLDDYRFVFVYQEIRAQKAVGIPSEQVSRLIDEMNADILLIEADGARRMPLKAPRPHEPVIPDDTTLVVPVAGLDALGKPLEEVTYNPQPIYDRYGFLPEALVQPAWIAQIVRDETLGLKNIPTGARIVALLNKADVSGVVYGRGRRVAQLMLRHSSIHSVAIGAVRRTNDPIFEVQQRIAAIVLAGGLSRRMGTSKPLLPWGDKTVIEHIVQLLAPFGFAEIVVVTGYKALEVEKVLKDYEVRTVFNPIYLKGEMLSSLKAGLRALPENISSALIVMGDQPQMVPRILHRILRASAHHPDTIVAPYFRDQRGHPILIPRRFWPSLLALTSGAPRDVINQHPITQVLVDTDVVLRDIDTPDQYAHEKRLAGLE